MNVYAQLYYSQQIGFHNGNIYFLGVHLKCEQMVTDVVAILHLISLHTA